MKTSNIKRIVKFKPQILAIMLLLAASRLNAQQAIDLSGAWIRNTEKCDAGQLSINSTPVQLLVTQNKTEIAIKRVSVNKQGDTSTYTETLKFDGTPGTSVVKQNLNKSAVIAWSPDHKQLTLKADYTDGHGNPAQKVKEDWSLSDDGKTLTIQCLLISNDKDYELTEVFDKNN